MHKNLMKSNVNSTVPQQQFKPSTIKPINNDIKLDNDVHLDTLHMGVAEPVSPEELEILNENGRRNKTESSTQKDGISTWILLSGMSQNIKPTSETPIRNLTVRHEAKIERVPKPNPTITPTKSKLKPDQKQEIVQKQNQKTTVRPKITTTTVKATIEPMNISKLLLKNKNPDEKSELSEISTTKPKKVTTSKPRLEESSTKPTIKKKSPTKTTSAVNLSSTSLANQDSTTELMHEPSSVSPQATESTTFLILEPKDADFDLPQDRSPGTTKKPKKTNKNVKNKTKKTDLKKPTKTNALQKDKPLATKIYNYLAREVMPTVGVGLVGLTVAAGLATYFLAPFGPVRRSYDITDRKDDDMYFYNNEELAGKDGQSEEEVFGKVIAGMPVNSPYRNSIRYQQQMARHPNQMMSRPSGAKFVQYNPVGPNHQPQTPYRIRNVAPPNYPAVKQQNYIYNQRRHDLPHPQQFYRYNNDGPAAFSSYRQNGPIPETPQPQKYQDNSDSEYDQNNAQQYSELIQQQQPTFTSEQQSVDAPQSDHESIDNNIYATIVTPEPQFPDISITTGANDNLADQSFQRRTSQFVVGSLQEQVFKNNEGTDEKEKEVADAVPEHGPRKKRQTLQNENELDAVLLPEEVTESILKDFMTTTTTDIDKDSNFGNIPTTSSVKPITTQKPYQSNLFNLLRDVFEMKFRMGLSFLQNTTMAVQRYLKNVERHVDESKIFNRSSEKTKELQ